MSPSQTEIELYYGFIKRDAETIKKIPMEFKKYDKRINLTVLSLDKLIKLTPNSSGRGEVIMIAPIIGNIQLKYLE